MMTEYLSSKLRNLSAVAILMVIYIHMFYREGTEMPSLMFVEKTIGSGFCSVAVPLFYAISGYLFFLKVPHGLESISLKLRKRVRTLLVPYLLANILTFLFYVVLNLIAIRVPMIDSIVNFKIFNTMQADGWLGTLNLVFIDPPIAFQLWFVRDLMVVMLFSPLIWITLNWLKKVNGGRIIAMIILLSLFLLDVRSGYMTAFIWFSVGGYFAVMEIIAGKKCSMGSAPLLIFAICYLVLSVLVGVGKLPQYYTRFVPVVGIPALWMAYDCLGERFLSNRMVADFSKYTFFIYLVHEPLLNIFKKLPLLMSRSEGMLLGCYLVIPVIFYISAAFLGKCLKRWFPRAYSIYTGGR